MSNASLKEQLQAVASQLSDIPGEEQTAPKKFQPREQRGEQHGQREQRNKMHRPAAVKPKWLDYVQYGVELLRAYFPACFKEINAVQPLKKGIKQDLVKQLSLLSEIAIEDKACMVKSLSYYVNTAAYHKSVVQDAVRINLEGNADGIVSAEEAKYSNERQQAKAQAKRAVPPRSSAQIKEEAVQ